MTTLPVNSIFSGMQQDGHWAGTPTLIIQLMEHPLAALLTSDSLDGSFPLVEWSLDSANEVSLNKLLARHGNSPHFSYVGPTTLAEIARSYRERHILVVAREPGRHDIAALVKPLLAAGRSVQVETTMMTASLVITNLWITLLVLPNTPVDDYRTENAGRPDEVLACIRRRDDLQRTETLFANRKMPVWLRPSPLAEDGIYRQCVAVATRHSGWRVTRPAKQMA